MSFLKRNGRVPSETFDEHLSLKVSQQDGGLLL